MVRKHYKKNNLTKIIWTSINHEIHPVCLEVFSTIAYQCLKSNNGKRPIMNEVVTQLEIALEYQLSTASVSTHRHQGKPQPTFQKLKEKFNITEQLRRLKPRPLNENLVLNVPKDLRRHICFYFVKKVPFFKSMNDRFLDDICERLKPHLFKRNTFIIREGDPVYALLFIVQGRIQKKNHRLVDGKISRRRRLFRR
ncbi:unnamed protein product [Lactuca virosa]|uniref:Cyclic nucleotide-binding domain-containing protein n=1 Tax=Lactuca virosa TaxID=75947 RepID=A0AAU9MHZ1_9ASTR|nr:unnamed protein product [Lactuca virosa]